MSRPLLAVAAALFVAAPAAAAPLTNYSLLTRDDVTLSSQTIAGRVLVGDDFVANSSTVGANLGAAANNSAVLLVKDGFKYDNSTMPNGGVIYGGANTSDVGQNYSNQVKTPNGTVTQGPLPVDPAALYASAAATAATLAGRTATGSFSEFQNNGIGRLDGLTAGLNVFNLTAADLASITTLKLFGTSDPTSAVLINVDATSYGNFLAVDLSGLVASDRVLFNFYNASTLSLGGWDLPATLLAPNATVTQSGGRVRGAVVAANFVGQGGGAIDGFGFDATPFAAAVPEPATWAMMIGGLGLIGAAMRRSVPRRQTALAA